MSRSNAHASVDTNSRRTDTEADAQSSKYNRGLGKRLSSNPESLSPIRAPAVFAGQWRTFAVGGIALLFWWLGFPLLIAGAFLIELAEADYTNRTETLAFVRFRHTIRDAISAIAVSVALFIPTLFAWVLFGGIELMSEAVSAQSQTLSMPSTIFYWLTLASTVFVTLVAVYIAPAVFVSISRVDSPFAVFSRDLVGTAFSLHYVVSWGVTLAIVFGAGFISVLLMGGLPVAGLVIGPSFMFYMLCVATIVISRAIEDSPATAPRPVGGTQSSSSPSQSDNRTDGYPTVEELRQQDNFRR